MSGGGGKVVKTCLTWLKDLFRKKCRILSKGKQQVSNDINKMATSQPSCWFRQLLAMGTDLR